MGEVVVAVNMMEREGRVSMVRENDFF